MDSTNAKPHRELPWIRMLLMIAAVCCTLFVIYASLVPLNYTALPLPVAWEKFLETPWLQLGIDRRADWVANGLIMLPSGFLAAGAVDWRRRRRLALILCSPLIILTLSAVVIAIEFVQIWFPPRVVSQNDIVAGLVGSVSGVVLWWIFGQSLLGKVEGFLKGEPGIERWHIVVNLGMLAICFYNLMPLDVILSFDELSAKYRLERFVWVPFSDFSFSSGSLIFFAYAFLRIFPYALLATTRLPLRLVILQSWLWVLLFELLKVPIYSRLASTTNVAAGLLGTLFIVYSAEYVWRVLRALDRSLVWFTLALGWTGIMFVGFFSRFDHLVSDPQKIEERFKGILTVPFARAHSSSEFDAGDNILLKLCVFALLSTLLSTWCSRLSPKIQKWCAMLAVVWVILVACAIEIGQVFLEPLVPDVTDLILYAAGACIGIVAARMLVPPPMRSVQS